MLGLLPNASNYTFLARAPHADGQEMLAVYKPRARREPAVGLPRGHARHPGGGGLRRRHGARMAHVPPTVLRDGPEGPGSVQRFVPFEPQEHYFTLQERFPDDVPRDGDVRPRREQRRPQGRPLPARRGRPDLGDRPRRVLPRGAEAAHRDLGVHRGADPRPPARRRPARSARDRRPAGRPMERCARCSRPARSRHSADGSAVVLSDPVFPEPSGERPFPWPPV